MRNQSQLALLRVALALRAYQLQHGEFPDSLLNLKPRYLQIIPGESFNAGQPLQYRRAQSKYLLYSIGPDRKDNAGKAIGSRANGQGNFYVSMSDKGDFVAGINS